MWSALLLFNRAVSWCHFIRTIEINKKQRKLSWMCRLMRQFRVETTGKIVKLSFGNIHFRTIMSTYFRVTESRESDFPLKKLYFWKPFSTKNRHLITRKDIYCKLWRHLWWKTTFFVDTVDSTVFQLRKLFVKIRVDKLKWVFKVITGRLRLFSTFWAYLNHSSWMKSTVKYVI